MSRRLTLVLPVLAWLSPTLVLAQGINPLPLLIQAESSGNPTAQSNSTTSSGLFGDVNATWAAALRACGVACGTTAQYPTASAAPASIQVAANSALINQRGLSDWLCDKCDAPFAAQVAAAGGASAFQTSGLDTNPADFSGLDTSAGLSSFLASGGTPLSSGGLGVGASGAAPPGDALGAGGGALGAGPTTVTNQPGTGVGPGSGVLDQIVNQFQQATQGWQAGLLTAATDLFWLLAWIELAVALTLLVINGGRPDWSEVAFTVIRWLFPTCLFWWLLQNGSTFAQVIINSLRQAGTAIGGTAITPSAVFWAGINIMTTILNNSHGFLDMVEQIPVMIAGLPIIIAFSLAAVWMLMALIESYFKIGLAALFLAFAGMRWTRGIAITLLMSCVAVGFKLLAITLITGLGTGFITQWSQNAAGLSFAGIFIMWGAAIAFAALVKIIPDSLERVVSGYVGSLAQPQHFTREAASTAALVAAPVLAAGGFTALAIQAFKHAAEEMASKSQQPQSALGRSGQIGLSVVGGIAGAAGSEISGRLGGLYRGGAGASATRMASNISQARRVAAAERARPVPPSNP